MLCALVSLAPLIAAASPTGPDDAWLLIDKAAPIAEAASSSSPVLDRVRSEARGGEGLFEAELSESLIAVRDVAPALALLDAAAVAPPCRARRVVDAAKGHALLALAEQALATALLDAHLDARAGSSSARAVSGVGRATTLAFLVEKCAGPPLDAFALSLDIHGRVRGVVWHLAEQRLIDARDLALLATQMTTSAMPVSLERALDGERARVGRAFNLQEQARIDALGRRLDGAMADRAALTAAATSFDGIARPQAFDPMAVELRCSKGKDGALPYTVSRAVVRALELRGPELLAADSQVMPTFDGRGVEITRAGTLASSCGFASGDLLVDVNGVATASADAMLAAPAAVARDGYAVFRVQRAGAVLEWRVVVEGRVEGHEPRR